jgi:hypothetical protein
LVSVFLKLKYVPLTVYSGFLHIYKTAPHDITDILLKMMLNTITLPPECVRFHMSFIPFRYNGYFII